jgi:hypothetical protein
LSPAVLFCRLCCCFVSCVAVLSAALLFGNVSKLQTPQNAFGFCRVVVQSIISGLFIVLKLMLETKQNFYQIIQ